MRGRGSCVRVGHRQYNSVSPMSSSELLTDSRAQGTRPEPVCALLSAQLPWEHSRAPSFQAESLQGASAVRVKSSAPRTLPLSSAGQMQGPLRGPSALHSDCSLFSTPSQSALVKVCV